MSLQIIDSCCLINLYASRNFLDILRAVEGGFFVPNLVKDESLFIRKEDEQDKTNLIPEAIDLTEALDKKLLHQCQLENEMEVQEFVRFATSVDDGEAICLALAKCRNCMVATDDRKAIRLANEENINIITTAEIVKLWADTGKKADRIIAETIQRIELYARFSPRKDFPEHDWWKRMAAISTL